MGSCFAKPSTGGKKDANDVFPPHFTEGQICDYFVDQLPFRLQGDGLHLLRDGPGPIVNSWTHELLNESGVHSFQDRELLLKVRDQMTVAVERHRERKRQLHGGTGGSHSSCRSVKRLSIPELDNSPGQPHSITSPSSPLDSAPGSTPTSPAALDKAALSTASYTDKAAAAAAAARHAAEAAAANTAAWLDADDGKPFHLTSDWLPSGVPLYRISEERLLRNMSSVLQDASARDGSARSGRLMVKTMAEDGGGGKGDVLGGSDSEGGVPGSPPRSAGPQRGSQTKSRLGRQPGEGGERGNVSTADADVSTTGADGEWDVANGAGGAPDQPHCSGTNEGRAADAAAATATATMVAVVVEVGGGEEDEGPQLETPSAGAGDVAAAANTADRDTASCGTPVASCGTPVACSPPPLSPPAPAAPPSPPSSGPRGSDPEHPEVVVVVGGCDDSGSGSCTSRSLGAESLGALTSLATAPSASASIWQVSLSPSPPPSAAQQQQQQQGQHKWELVPEEQQQQQQGQQQGQEVSKATTGSTAPVDVRQQ